MTVQFCAIPVREGDAFLLTIPDGHYLVDGGVELNHYLPGELLKRGVNHLDAAACTRTDADHVNGILDLMQNTFSVDEYWLPATWLDLARAATLFDCNWGEWGEWIKRQIKDGRAYFLEEAEKVQSPQQARSWDAGERRIALASVNPTLAVRTSLFYGSLVLGSLALLALQDVLAMPLANLLRRNSSEGDAGSLPITLNLRRFILAAKEASIGLETDLRPMLYPAYREIDLVVQALANRVGVDAFDFDPSILARVGFPFYSLHPLGHRPPWALANSCERLLQRVTGERELPPNGIRLIRDLCLVSQAFASACTVPSTLRFFECEKAILFEPVRHQPFKCINGREVVAPLATPPVVTPKALLLKTALSFGSEQSLVYYYETKQYEVLFCADSDFSFAGSLPAAKGAISLRKPSLATAPHHGSAANADVYEIVEGTHADPITWVRSDKRNATRPCPAYRALATKFCTTCQHRPHVEVQVDFDSAANRWVIGNNPCDC